MFLSYDDYPSYTSVKKEYTSSSMIVKVEGGWKVFEFVDDYETWKNQK